MASSKPVVLLSSSEGDVFEVDESIAWLSPVIKNMMEECCAAPANNKMSLPGISTEVLKKVIEYLDKHAEKQTEKQELGKWDEKFIEDANCDTLFGLITAANFLDVECLLDLTAQAIADMIKDKSAEWYREVFNVVNDYTPEEEAQLRRELAWALE